MKAHTTSRGSRLLPLLSLSLACSATAPPLDGETRPAFSICARVVDERGAPIGEASFSSAEQRWQTAADGTLMIDNRTDSLQGVIRAEGFLDEPVVFGETESCATVTMFRAAGRISLHFGGDLMLARRYESGVDSPSFPPRHAQTTPKVWCRISRRCLLPRA